MTARRAIASVLIVGMLLSIGLATVVSFYASGQPDGLERVAADIGFAEAARESRNADWPLADYGVAGVEDERLSVGAAGFLGLAITGVVGLGVFALVRPRTSSST